MVPFRYNLRSLAVRRRTTAAAGLGIALVVFVMAGAMMLSEGIERTLRDSGRADNVIVLRKGSDTEMTSGFEERQVGLILSAPGVKKNEKNEPQGVGEVVVVASMEKKGTDGLLSNVQIRGVPDNVWAFRPDAHIVAGRTPKPATDEVAIGARIRGRFKGLELGSSFDIKKNRKVEVVGVFDAGGSSFESEVWADRDTIRTSFGREAIVSSATIRLESPSKFDGFNAVIEGDKQLGLLAQKEITYYERQSERTATFVKILGNAIAFFFSVGAMIGAMITMYGQVSNRVREIGTLRALGFSKLAILTSFLAESTVLALGGALVGAAASLAMGLVKFSMINFATWSEIVFSFTPTPRILLTAILFGGAMGLVGGFFPAIRAARVSPIKAMRA